MTLPTVQYSGVTPIGIKVADIVVAAFDNGSGVPAPVTSTNPLPVTLQNGSVNITGPVTVSNEVEIKNDSGNPVPVSVSSSRTAVNVVITNGTSVSAGIDLTNTAILGFLSPAAWTAAALNFEVSADNSTWITGGIFDSLGSAVGSYSTPAVSTAYSLDPISMLPWRYVRFRSGTSGSPVNQGADRTFVVITRPLA